MKTRRAFWIAVAVLFSPLATTEGRGADATAPRPNIVYLLADDLAHG